MINGTEDVKDKIENAERVLFIGDVHGCYVELIELLEKIKFNKESDFLVFVGDLIGKGPKSVEVVRYIKNELREVSVSVKGNHDHFASTSKKKIEKGEMNLEDVAEPTHQEVIKNLTNEEFEWLENLPLYIKIEKYSISVIHAGLVPGIPVESQEPYDLMNLRNVKKENDVYIACPNTKTGEAWAKMYQGEDSTIIFGHDAVRGLQQENFAIGLDTGCCYGKFLTGYLLPSKELVQIKAKQVYCQPNISLNYSEINN